MTDHDSDQTPCSYLCCPICDPPLDFATLSRCGPATAGLLDRLEAQEALGAAALPVQPQTQPAGDSGSGTRVARQEGNPDLWPDKYRIQAPDGGISAAWYGRLCDAIEAVINRPGRFAIYRETAESDLKLCARVTGRGEACGS